MATVPVLPCDLTESDPFPADCARKFVFRKRLGGGGFGAVFLATHRDLGCDAALDLLHGDLASMGRGDYVYPLRCALASRIDALPGHTRRGLYTYAPDVYGAAALRASDAIAEIAPRRHRGATAFELVARTQLLYDAAWHLKPDDPRARLASRTLVWLAGPLVRELDALRAADVRPLAVWGQAPMPHRVLTSLMGCGARIAADRREAPDARRAASRVVLQTAQGLRLLPDSWVNNFAASPQTSEILKHLRAVLRDESAPLTAADRTALAALVRRAEAPPRPQRIE